MVSTAGSLGRRSLLSDHGAAEIPAESPVTSQRLELKSLFERHYESVWRLLRRFGVPPAQLDDAAQEVFWVASRRLLEIRPGSESAFLYGVALRIASNLLRRDRNTPASSREDELMLLADTGPSPEEAVEQRRRRALLDAVLDRMPLELRTVFVLFELEGLEVRAIAALEEIPVGTASSRLRRAREEFSAIARRVRATLLSGRGPR
jgi:RNA polymerase sigma-70 factor (ECF subfamily)